MVNESTLCTTVDKFATSRLNSKHFRNMFKTKPLEKHTSQRRYATNVRKFHAMTSHTLIMHNVSFSNATSKRLYSTQIKYKRIFKECLPRVAFIHAVLRIHIHKIVRYAYLSLTRWCLRGPLVQLCNRCICMRPSIKRELRFITKTHLSRSTNL